jgi:hypothetical protein
VAGTRRNGSGFLNLLINSKFDIVVLSALVNGDGTVTFGRPPEHGRSLLAEGVVNLLETAEAKLLEEYYVA